MGISLLFVNYPASSILGSAVKDSFGDYYVVIDECLSSAEKLEAYVHEMRHIQMNHFNRNISVRQAEEEVNK
jgi:hypothetical protein